MSPAPAPTFPGHSPSTDSPSLNVWLALRRLADSWWGALLGGGVYGAWATWANWEQGPRQAAVIGFSHWMTSAALTLFGTAAMRRFYGSPESTHGWLRAFGGGLALTYATLFTVHGLLGTMHLWLTLAPGLVPNILFCGSYAALLQRTLPARRHP